MPSSSPGRSKIQGQNSQWYVVHIFEGTKGINTDILEPLHDFLFSTG